MAEWLNSQLKQVGVDTKLVDLGRHTMDGQDLPLPPAILGRVGNDSTKKTVLIYGHFDVQPVRSRFGQILSIRSINRAGKQVGWLGH
jgi:Cys-Gly metallodipeptidase DUG1